MRVKKMHFTYHFPHRRNRPDISGLDRTTYK